MKNNLYRFSAKDTSGLFTNYGVSPGAAYVVKNVEKETAIVQKYDGGRVESAIIKLPVNLLLVHATWGAEFSQYPN